MSTDSQNKNTLLERLQQPRWGRIPWDKFDEWYIKDLVEEQADIAKDLGMYERMLENSELTKENRALVKNLIKLDNKRYWLLENKIGELRNG